MFEALFLLGTLSLGFNARFLGLGLSDFFYFGALFALIVTGILKKKSLDAWLPGHHFWVSAVLVLAGGLLAAVISRDPTNGLVVTFKTFYLFSFWMTMGIIMALRKKEQWVLWALIAAALFTASIATWDRLTGSLWGPTIGEAIGVVFPGIGYQVLAQYYGRYTGVMGHPNVQSEFLLVVTPIVMNFIWDAWRRKSLLQAIMWVGILGILISGIYLTGSVAGLVGLAVAFGIFAFAALYATIPRSLVRLLVITSILGLSAVLLLQVLGMEIFQPLAARLSANTNLNRAFSDSGPGRIELIAETGKLILDNPLVGYGMDLTLPDQANIFRAETGGVHNAILRSWIAGGLLAFLGILYAYWRALRLAWDAVARQFAGYQDRYIFGLGVSILVWFLIDLVQPSFSQRFTWLIAALLYGIFLRLARAESFVRHGERVNAPAVHSEPLRPVSDGLAD